jgi:hypothetical protein
VLESHNDDHSKGLIMRGIKNNKGSSNRGRFRSKLKSRKIKCFEHHEVWYFRKNFLSGKIREIRKPLMLQMLLVKGKFFMMLKVFWLYILAT